MYGAENRSDELLAFAAFVQRTTGAAEVASVAGGGKIQSLWGGYGELVRVRLIGAERPSVVVKWARLPAHRFGESGASHERKCRSYEVETAFYRQVSSRCEPSCRVAKLEGARVRSGEWLLVLEDLDEAGFPRRSSGRQQPRGADLEACLGWLASFHARFLGESAEANGLWTIGGYWHLGTRQDELRTATRTDPTWPARAAEIDRQLRAARFTTLVHGDAKPANFCFAADTSAVAAVDFQYCGGGPGIVDVAYLLHGDPPDATARSLEVYFERLRAALPDGVDEAALEAEWRALFPIAIADFDRFLAGWHR